MVANKTRTLFSFLAKIPRLPTRTFLHQCCFLVFFIPAVMTRMTRLLHSTNGAHSTIFGSRETNPASLLPTIPGDHSPPSPIPCDRSAPRIPGAPAARARRKRTGPQRALRTGPPPPVPPTRPAERRRLPPAPEDSVWGLLHGASPPASLARRRGNRSSAHAPSDFRKRSGGAPLLPRGRGTNLGTHARRRSPLLHPRTSERTTAGAAASWTRTFGADCSFGCPSCAVRNCSSSQWRYAAKGLDGGTRGPQPADAPGIAAWRSPSGCSRPRPRPHPRGLNACAPPGGGGRCAVGGGSHGPAKTAHDSTWSSENSATNRRMPERFDEDSFIRRCRGILDKKRNADQIQQFPRTPYISQIAGIGSFSHLL